MTNEQVTSLPYRLESFGHVGWSIRRFENAKEAARFFRAFPGAAMPCWQRCEIVNGELIQVR